MFYHEGCERAVSTRATWAERRYFHACSQLKVIQMNQQGDEAKIRLKGATILKSLTLFCALLIVGCGEVTKSGPTSMSVKTTLECATPEYSRLKEPVYLGLYEERHGVVDYVGVLSENRGDFYEKRYESSFEGRHINFGIYRLDRSTLELWTYSAKLYDCKLSFVDLNMIKVDLYAKEAAHKHNQKSLKDSRM